MRRPTVLLAEDHVATAEQLCALLQINFDVVGVVGDGQAAVRLAARLRPEVVVMDISMPVLDGIDAVVQILQRDPDARIVLVTVHSEPALVQRALAAGALGYVLKDAAGDDLAASVHAALARERYVGRGLGHAPKTRLE